MKAWGKGTSWGQWSLFYDPDEVWFGFNFGMSHWVIELSIEYMFFRLNIVVNRNE